MSKLEKTRLFMVMSYLHSIEDPYQYGDNYGDLVEYLKMLIEGEEEYVPEGKKYTLSWMQKNEDEEWETKSKLVNWEDIRGMEPVDILRSGLLGEATHVKDMRLTESSTRDSWALNSKHKYFAKENKPTKWSHNERDFFEKHLKDSDYWRYPKFGKGIDVGHATKGQKGKRVPHPKFIEWIKENAVRLDEDGKIITDKETSEKDGVWGLNPHSILTTLEFNEKRLDGREDELTKKLNNIIEEASDLIEEEYAHAKWKKMYEDKKLHREVRKIIHRFKQY